MHTRHIAASVVVVAILGALAAYLYLRSDSLPEPPPPVVSEALPPPASSSVEPQIRFPIREAPESKPLPALGESDPGIQETLTSLFGRDALARFFNTDGMVRRFVATIDNLPRQAVAQRIMPVKPVPGAFSVSSPDGAVTINADNYLRYRPYVVAMEAVEAKRLVAAYVHFYPLVQAAYQELGYPNAYFNDRLVETIDDLLITPDVPSPKLVQPKVMYEFADPNLEALSAGQKMMIRMGSANAERVKAKLRAIRHELTSQSQNR